MSERARTTERTRRIFAGLRRIADRLDRGKRWLWCGEGKPSLEVSPLRNTDRGR